MVSRHMPPPADFFRYNASSADLFLNDVISAQATLFSSVEWYVKLFFPHSYANFGLEHNLCPLSLAQIGTSISGDRAEIINEATGG